MGTCVGCGKKMPFLRMLCADCKRGDVFFVEPKSPKRPIREEDE